MYLKEQTSEEKKQFYLQHVNQFYDHVKNWLQDKSQNNQLIVEKTPVEIYEKALGTYNTKMLSIQTPDKDVAIDMKPIGACAVLAEGMIELESWLGKEHIVYMPSGGPMFTEPSGSEQPIYRGITEEGWYWIESSRRTKAYKMDKELLLELMTMVSDHAF